MFKENWIKGKNILVFSKTMTQLSAHILFCLNACILQVIIYLTTYYFGYYITEPLRMRDTVYITPDTSYLHT